VAAGSRIVTVEHTCHAIQPMTVISAIAKLLP
jgi:hypothetical protein